MEVSAVRAHAAAAVAGAHGVDHAVQIAAREEVSDDVHCVGPQAETESKV